MDDLSTLLPFFLGAAWLLPLASFTLIVLFGPRMGKHGAGAGWLATSAIGVGFLLSLVALISWVGKYGIGPADDHMAQAASAETQPAHPGEPGHSGEHAGGHHAAVPPKAYTGEWYTLGQFGKLKITIGYYIDALTVAMFTM